MSNFVIDLWSEQPGDYFFLASKIGSTFETYPIKRKDMKRLVPQIIAEEGSDKNIYFCPHGFSAPRRVKENAVMPHILYADLDEADPRTMKPRPTMALQSSPGRYVGFWKTDKAITEDLNKALTRLVGADKGGYDLTQVLRVPDTINFKYKSRPRVKVLWDNGPKYKISALEKMMPKPTKKNGDIVASAWEIWKKYRSKSPQIANLIEGEKPSDRSGAQGNSYEKMSGLGMSIDEIETVWRAVPWAKGGDYDRDKKPGWLRADIERMLGKSDENPFAKKRKSIEDDDEVEEVDDLWDSHISFEDGSIDMSQVKPDRYEWIFHPFFARKELTIVQGDPSVGKSYFLQMVCLRLVQRLGFRRLMERDLPKVSGPIIYFDPENLASHITIHRLMWNGFDPEKDKGFRVETVPASVGSPDFRNHIYSKMEEHKPVMVVFDTLLHYSHGDANSNVDMTKLMGWFIRLARRYNCSVVVVRHMNKSAGRNAMTSGSGATAVGGVTRLMTTVGYHPEDRDVRLVTSTKGSMTSNKLKVPGFHIESIPTEEDPDKSRFIWEKELFDIDPDEMIAQNMRPVDAENKKKAKWAEYANVLKRIFENVDDMSIEGVLKAFHAEGLDATNNAIKHYTRARVNLGIASEWQVNAEGKKSIVWKLVEQKKLDDYKATS